MNLIDLLKSDPQDVEDNGYGGLHIPIDKLEDKLDDFTYSTQNFKWQLYMDKEGNQCVAASLEVIIFTEAEISDKPSIFGGQPVKRTFVGSCNFKLADLLPIEDWLSTAKSMCVKNAASDAGRYLGRGLNTDALPQRVSNGKGKREAIKRKPDAFIMNKYMNAVATGEQATIDDLLENYDIKTEKDF
jgi:hypothetical protein